MRCCKCGENNKVILAEITDKNSSAVYCPNCLLETIANFEATKGSRETCFFENSDEFIDDITDEKGAVIYKSQDESYSLDAETMLRLIDHSLYPDEYFELADKYGYDKFHLHSDFYDDCDGEALQPLGIIDDGDYVSLKKDELINLLNSRTEMDVLVGILGLSDVPYDLEILENGYTNLFICGKNDKIKIVFDENEKCVSDD
jgi:hypothetical protein